MKPFAVLSICLFIVVPIGLSISNAAQYDPEVYQAQKALKVRGYNPGTPDGLWGKSTESAIKHFQVDNELPISGKLDEQTKAKLGITSTARSMEQNQLTKERRLALVIGNSSYKSSPLINPVNDAQDMATALRDLGFEVTHKANADQRTMEDAIFEFSKSLKKGGVGLFYYAGHGVQVHGKNFLIPIQANIRVERDIKYKAVDAGQVLDGMFDAGNGLNIVLLDACRDNPFARSFRTSSRGLARMDAPTGTFIAYATAPGSTAADGGGRNGVFTQYFLKNMTKPGLKIEDVMKRVRNAVIDETNNKQVPWQASSLTGDFYFASSGAVLSKPAEMPSASTIEISANVTGARVLVDGREVGTTPVSGIEVSPGSHRIHVEKEGYNPYEKHVQVEAGRTFSMQVYLDETKPKKGRLYVETDPGDAKVNISGIGRFYQGIELEPGRYRVEVSAEGFETKALRVTLSAGEDKSLDIRLSKKTPATSSYTSGGRGNETARDGRFIAYDNGTVKDTETGLMWAEKDNRGDINWDDAKRYCESYRGGGYTDWRMPTQDELAGLYDKSESYQATQRDDTVHLTELIELSTCCPWASETRGSAAAGFHFDYGGRYWFGQSFSFNRRALPVRSGK